MSQVAGSSLVEGVLVDWVVGQPPWLPRLPVQVLDREQTAAELQRVVAQRAMLAAYEAELVWNLADASPDSDDPPPGTRGARSSWGAQTPLPGVSEFFPAELATIVNCGRGTAGKLAVRAGTWRESLPGTWRALAAGVLDEPRAKALAEVLEHADPQVARRVEAQLLPQATELSLRRLRERALALLVTVDAAGADERRTAAEKSADVRVYPSVREGMATVAAELPADEAAAVCDVVNQLAGMLKADGDARPIGQLRTRVFADALLRVWDSTRPAVTAQLQITAPLAALTEGSAEAGVVSGLAITAAHLRELLRRLDVLGVQRPAGGSVTLAVTGEDGALLGTATLDQLQTLARRGCPEHPGGDCRCAVLAAPEAVDRYRPGAAQERFVRTRDRTCRFPNCGQRVGWADLDHVLAHACGGATDCANLCCLCRSHHRLKTFARGWRFQMSEDGVLSVTTPSGVTRTTRPPGMRPPPDPGLADTTAPPGPQPREHGTPGPETTAGGRDAPVQHLGIRELIRRHRPRPPGTARPDADDPAPY